MVATKPFLARLNGWALSLLLHGGVALVAGVSVFSVHVGGGSGRGSGGMEGGLVTSSFAATLRSGDEQVVSGTVFPDVPQYGRLTTEDTILEPLTEEPALPTVAFDVFAVGSSEPERAIPEQAPAEPLPAHPSGGADGRTVKLPPPSTAGNGQEGTAGSAGQGGSGGGDSDGNGSGEGSGQGNATGVYTPSPAYPTEARRRNIEGSVLVEFAIASDGSCAVRKIVESSGFGPLDDAVEKTVAHWKYRSSQDDGRPETTTKRIRFTFRLGQH
jgi:TonB family protein